VIFHDVDPTVAEQDIDAFAKAGVVDSEEEPIDLVFAKLARYKGLVLHASPFDTL